jgi:hypothetical protein
MDSIPPIQGAAPLRVLPLEYEVPVDFSGTRLRALRRGMLLCGIGLLGLGLCVGLQLICRGLHPLRPLALAISELTQLLEQGFIIVEIVGGWIVLGHGEATRLLIPPIAWLARAALVLFGAITIPIFVYLIPIAARGFRQPYRHTGLQWLFAEEVTSFIWDIVWYAALTHVWLIRRKVDSRAHALMGVCIAVLAASHLLLKMVWLDVALRSDFSILSRWIAVWQSVAIAGCAAQLALGIGLIIAGRNALKARP